MKSGASPTKWLLALLLCLSAACASAAQEANGHGELSPDVFPAMTAPSPRPLDGTTSHSTRLQKSAAKSLVIPQAGEGGKVSLRDAHVKSFVRGSYQAIVSARAGKPFIISFWSLTCTNCREDLALFGRLAKKYRNLDLVLVATDTPEQKQEIASTLQHYRLGSAGLGRIESWVFADSYTERLRFEVDAQWYGELPRTYFFDAAGHSTAVSGKIDRVQVERWVRESGKRG